MNANYVQQYRRLYEQHWWWRARERLVLDAITRWHRAAADDRVLDIGCGDGLLFEQLARLGEVEGVEVDPLAVSPDNPHAARIHIRPFDNTFQPDDPYSLITMLDVLEHLPNAAATMNHLAGLLAPNGTLVVTVPAFRSLWTRHDDLNHHVTRYTRSTLLPLFRDAGLTILDSRYLFHWTALAKLGVRMKEAVIRGEPRPPTVGAAWINRMLLNLTLAEARLLSPWGLPFGTSLLVVARRSANVVKSPGPLSPIPMGERVRVRGPSASTDTLRSESEVSCR